MMPIKKIFFSIFFIIIGWILCHTYNNLIKSSGVIPEVTTVEVKKGNLVEKLSLSARVVVEKDMIPITSFVSTVVEKVYVKPNDLVKEGDILLELRKDELVSTLKKEEFSLDLAKRKQILLKDDQNHPEIIEKNEQIKNIEWDLSKAEQSLEGARELYTKKALAYQEVQDKELEIKRLQMNLNKSLREAKDIIRRLTEEKEELETNIPSLICRVNELNKQTQNCVILSPVNGIVKQIPIEKNKKVEYGTLLMSISTNEKLVAKGSLKESNFFLVKEGQAVLITSKVLGKSYKGRVGRMGASAKVEGQKPDEDTIWDVNIQISNPEGLVIGMGLSCEIMVKEYQNDALVIPSEALYEENVVFVVENNRLRKKGIKTGHSTPDQIEVISGIALGDRVVVQYPEGELKEGMEIKERR